MKMKQLVLAAAIAVVSAIPSVASGQASIGGFLGREWDTEEDWLFFGAEARLGVANFPFVINPRFSHLPFDGGSVSQIDVNFVHDVRLASPNTFLPFMGIGFGYTTYSFDDADGESKAGLNLVAGTRIVFTQGSAVQGMLQTQYTAIEDFANRYMLSLGLIFALGG